MSGRLRHVFGQLSYDFREPGAWKVTSYKNRLISQIDELKKNQPELKMPRPYYPQPGDLVKIFKTVSDGDVQWSGVVKLERERNYRPFPQNPDYGQQEVFGYWIHGLQEDLGPEEWAAMFFDRLPAKLERNGKEIFGVLEPFSEQGSEGIHWALADFEGEGHYALHFLKDGDRLTVYSAVRDGEVGWEGRFDPVPATVEEKEAAFTDTVQRGMGRAGTRLMAFRHCPVLIEPK